MKPQPARCDRAGCRAAPHNRHDDYLGYRYGCRSPAAKLGDRRYRKLWAAGLSPQSLLPIGPTARRLQALSALGWPGSEIAARAGLHRSVVQCLRQGTRYPTVTRERARTVDRVFTELWDQPGPSDRVRADAARHGWAPAAAFDDLDDMAEEPKLGGTRAPVVALTGEVAHRRCEVARLTAAGRRAHQIARELGITERSVVRHRAALTATHQEAAA